MGVAMLRLRLAGTGDEELLLNRPELTIGRAPDNNLIDRKSTRLNSSHQR